MAAEFDWFAVFHAVWSKSGGLTSCERNVMTALLKHTNNTSEGHCCLPLWTLVMASGYSKASVCRALASLETAGWLTRVLRRGAATEYRLKLPDGAAPLPSEGSHPETPCVLRVSQGETPEPEGVSQRDTCSSEGSHSETPGVSQRDTPGPEGVSQRDSPATPLPPHTPLSPGKPKDQDPPQNQNPGPWGYATSRNTSRARARRGADAEPPDLRPLTDPEREAAELLLRLPEFRGSDRRIRETLVGASADYPLHSPPRVVRDLLAKAYRSNGQPAYRDWLRAYRNWARVDHRTQERDRDAAPSGSPAPPAPEPRSGPGDLARLIRAGLQHPLPRERQ